MPEPDLEVMVDELSVWIRTESPTHAPEAVNRMMDLVASEAEEAGIACERLAGKQGLGDTLILRAGPRSDGPGLLLLAHLDTVHFLAHDRARPAAAARGRPSLRPGRLRHEGRRLSRPAGVQARRGARRRRPAAGLPRDAGRGDRQPDDACPDRGFRRRSAYTLVLEPARDGGKIVTSRKGVGRFDVRVKAAGACRLAPRGRAQRRPRSRPPDPAHREHDRLRARRDDHGRHDRWRQRRQRHPAALPLTVDLRVATTADGEAYRTRSSTSRRTTQTCR